jgi:hypothetical protein
MRTGKDTMKDVIEQVNVDDITDLKEELDDYMAKNKER